METNDIKKIWEQTDNLEINLDKEQLKSIIMKKNKNTFYGLVMLLAGSVIVCLGMLAYLIISASLMYPDIVYLIINAVLFIFILIILAGCVSSYKEFHQNVPENSGLNDLVEHSVRIYEKSCTQFKYQNLMIIIFLIFFNLSLHLFLIRKPFPEAFSSSHSIIGLSIGFIIGISLGIYLTKKIAKYYNTRIQQLKDNLKELSSI